jgi:hypothetical protein
MPLRFDEECGMLPAPLTPSTPSVLPGSGRYSLESPNPGESAIDTRELLLADLDQWTHPIPDSLTDLTKAAYTLARFASDQRFFFGNALYTQDSAAVERAHVAGRRASQSASMLRQAMQEPDERTYGRAYKIDRLARGAEKALTDLMRAPLTRDYRTGERQVWEDYGFEYGSRRSPFKPMGESFYRLLPVNIRLAEIAAAVVYPERRGITWTTDQRERAASHVSNAYDALVTHQARSQDLIDVSHHVSMHLGAALENLNTSQRTLGLSEIVLPMMHR